MYSQKDGKVFAYSEDQNDLYEHRLSQDGHLPISYDDAVKLSSSLFADYIPSHVTRAQGKAALIRAGLWRGVIDYVASIEDAKEKALADVSLNDTTHWQRTSPFLNAAATALGLTQTQLDDLFVTASGIEL